MSVVFNNLDKSRILTKSLAVLHIKRDISITAEKIYNELIFLARPQFKTGEVTHFTTLKYLRGILDTKSKDNTFVRNALKELAMTRVEFNIFGKVRGFKEDTDGCSALLADLRITGNTVEYSFSPLLREDLKNPRLYAKINLIDQNKFSSKHSLSIWELCLGELGANKGKEVVLKISVDKLSDFFGRTGHGGTFKVLNKYILKPAIIEINEKTNLEVSLDYMKGGNNGQTITHILINIKDCGSAIKNKPVLEDKTKEQPLPEDAIRSVFSSPTANEQLMSMIADIKRSHPLKYAYACELIRSVSPDNSIYVSTVESYLQSVKFSKLSEQGLFIYNIYDIVDARFSFVFRKLCESIIQEMRIQKAA